MRRRMLNGKLHRARVTGTELDYVGSITVDASLLDRAGILPYEQVAVYNLANGARFETYAIEGAAGEVCVNGAAAHLVAEGDRVIVVSFVDLDDAEVAHHRPSVVVLDGHNRPIGG